MKRLITISLLLLLGTCLLVADDASAEKAATYYKNGAYADALTEYLSCHEKAPNNVSVLYNIGNTYFRLNELGKAICFYRRALKFSPQDKQIKTNLLIAKSKTVDKNIANEKPDLIKTLFNGLRAFSYNTYLIIFIVGLSITNGLLFLMIKQPKGELFRNIFFVVLVIFLLFSFLFYHRSKQEFVIKQGVIITKKVAVKSEPSQTLKTLFFIHEGMDFILNKQVGDWIEIELQNGFTGWIHEDNYWMI